MIKRLIGFAIQQRLVMLALSVLFVMFGLYAYPGGSHRAGRDGALMLPQWSPSTAARGRTNLSSSARGPRRRAFSARSKQFSTCFAVHLVRLCRNVAGNALERRVRIPLQGSMCV
jgi:hypothetical protein